MLQEVNQSSSIEVNFKITLTPLNYKCLMNTVIRFHLTPFANQMGYFAGGTLCKLAPCSIRIVNCCGCSE